jgi:hypothetical protein
MYKDQPLRQNPGRQKIGFFVWPFLRIQKGSGFQEHKTVARA